MLRVLTRLGPISISSLMPLKWLKNPDEIERKLIKDFNQFDPNLTNMERVKKMFTIQDGAFSDEFNFVCQSTIMASVIGVLFGGILTGINTQKDFIARNQASTYFNAREGKKALLDKITLEFMKGGYRIGWRMALFTGCYTLTSKVIQVYRGEPSVIEYIVGGTVTGMLYKINMGMKAAISGGIIGTILGVICGGATMLILSVTDISMGDVHLWQHQYRQRRIADFQRINIENEQPTELQQVHDKNLKLDKKEDLIFGDKK